MKELIIQALDSAFEILERRVPQTYKSIKTISIQDVNPLELESFMARNNIPSGAYFTGTDNGYDGWNDVVLAWDVDIPTTEKDKLLYMRKYFTPAAWKFVFGILTKNGYKRVGFNTGALRQFDDTTVYDMYMSKDIDRLVEYYTLSFVKKG